MSASSSSAWAIWLVIGVMLAVAIGIIIWFAIDASTEDQKTPTYTTKNANAYPSISKTVDTSSKNVDAVSSSTSISKTVDTVSSSTNVNPSITKSIQDGSTSISKTMGSSPDYLTQGWDTVANYFSGNGVTTPKIS